MPIHLLPPRLQAEITAGKQVYPLAEFDWPDGTTERMSQGGAPVHGVGQYSDRILKWSPIPRGVSGDRSRISLPETAIEIRDDDNSFGARVNGPPSEGLAGSACRIYIASPTLAQADWYAAYTGQLHRWEMVGRRRWSLRLRPNDRALRGLFPKAVITTTDWTSAHQTSYGLPGPIVLGLHDSRGIQAKGAVPTLCLVGNTHYLVSLGVCKSVPRVYKDGTLQGSGYTIEHMVVGGRSWTVIKFNADIGADAVVTCDVEGLTDSGDGLGNLVDDPCDALKLLLVQFVFGDWRTGTYLDDSTAPIETAYFARTKEFLSARGYKASKRFAGKQFRAIDEVDRWADSFQVKTLWTDSGKLGVLPEDHGQADIYYAPHRVIFDQHLIGDDLAMGYEAENLTDSVNVRFLFSEVDTQYIRSVNVTDVGLELGAVDEIEAAWSRAALVGPEDTTEYLYVDATTNSPVGLTVVSSQGTVDAAIRDLVGANDGDTSYLGANNVSPLEPRCSLNDMPTTVHSITSVTLIATARRTAAGGTVTPFIYPGAKYTFSITLADTYQTFQNTWTTNPATGVAWTLSDLQSLQVGAEIGGDGANSGRLTQLLVAVSYRSTVGDLAQARDVASRRQVAYARPRGSLNVRGNLQLLDIELLSEVRLSHPDGPTASGGGWGLERHEARLMRVMERSFNPGDMSVQLKLQDLE